MVMMMSNASRAQQNAYGRTWYGAAAGVLNQAAAHNGASRRRAIDVARSGYRLPHVAVG